MEPFRHRYCPTRDNSLQRNFDRPRLLPSFDHLLRSLNRTDAPQDLCPTSNLWPSSSLTLDGENSNRTESEDTTFDLCRLSPSIDDRHLVSDGVISHAHAGRPSLLSQSIGQVGKHGPLEIGSRSGAIITRHAIHGDSRACRNRKRSHVGYSLSAPRTVAPNSTCLSSDSNQRTMAQSRLHSRYNAHRPRNVQLTLRLRKSYEDYAPSNSQYRQAGSSTQYANHSHFPTHELVPSLSTGLHEKEHFYGPGDMYSVISNTTQREVPHVALRIPWRASTGLSNTICLPIRCINDETCVENKESFTLTSDPARTDPVLTRHYLDIFFDEINVPVFNVLPRTQFIAWCLDWRCKSMLDRVMLYALMSCATHFCARSSSSDYRVIFKNIVYRGLELQKLHHCLQSVHALLFLAFTEYGDRNYQAGSDVFAKCMKTVSSLALNVEQVAKVGARAYGLSANIDAECRRRTCWATFCFDSHLGLNKACLRLLNGDDINIRLPCEDKLYDCEWLLQQPCLETDDASGISAMVQEADTQSRMAHVIEITLIHADILSNASHNEIVLGASGRGLDDRLCRWHLRDRLRAWSDTYSNTLQADKSDFANALLEPSDNTTSRRQQVGIGGLHMLYYNSEMVLSRRICHRGLDKYEVLFHARHATINALQALKLTEQVMSARGSAISDYLSASRGFSTVHTILNAIDILTAVGRVSDILEPGSRLMSLMYSGLDLLDHLGSWWGHNFVKYGQVKERIQAVFRAAEAALIADKAFFYCSNPLDNTANKDFDVVYGTDRKHYIRLAYPGGESIEDEDIYEVNTR